MARSLPNAAFATGLVALLAACEAAGPSPAGSVDPVRAELPAPPPSANLAPAAPGSPVYALTAPGPGACAGTTLAAVIAAIHARWPELADVSRLHQPEPRRAGDGSAIHAFTPDGGFALAFKRGGGDCPAGCTEHEYWYFTTDATCAAEQVGHYRAGWLSGACLTATGTPLWGLPAPPDPALVCGEQAPRSEAP